MTTPADMDCVILCGGQGTRLREETEFKPKPMVDVGGRPILWHIMRYYHSFGVRNFTLCLGYKGEMIRDYFLNYRNHHNNLAINLRSNTIEILSGTQVEDWRITLADTGAETMTGCRIKRVLPYLRNNTFFATYGDGVSTINIDHLLTSHQNMGRLATVSAVHPSSRYGELNLKDGLVRTFQEKPQTSDGWINGGFMVFEKEAFKDVDPMDESVTLEVGVLQDLSDAGQLAVYKHDGFWQCMDTFREMQLLNRMWDDGKAPWRVWDESQENAETKLSVV